MCTFLITLPDSDLGVSEISKVDFEVYPNPTTDIINIKTKGKLSSSTLYNLNGEVVLKSTDSKINVKNLFKGIYVLRTLIDGKESTKKIIKN
ncbi:T9SS type A sorting domain-containing protein [Empedobacter falsenii]|uniref:T9SS type A sorting domain-containing protein n=1 Tax=Empedobacter falsenii TaxID=343874 RepID=UPI001C8D89EF|nr:T9SS type A sorting domain-containing protein [Empedobacter falsenii]MBY0068281.1 T9SS type A sorting domain-containing protein [Empedobacter falsenii]